MGTGMEVVVGRGGMKGGGGEKKGVEGSKKKSRIKSSFAARSVGSRTTCTVRAETTQDGTIHAWKVCICLLGSMQTPVVEMCLIGTRGCALSLSTCRVRFRDTQRALLSQTIPQPTRCIPHVPQVTSGVGWWWEGGGGVKGEEEEGGGEGVCVWWWKGGREGGRGEGECECECECE